MYSFQEMTEEFAREICFSWHYSGAYSFYNMVEDPGDLEEFLNPVNWNRIFAVLVDDTLHGFFQFEKEYGYTYIGFGLRPDLTGKGLGKDFVLSGINFLISTFHIKQRDIRLSVATFNRRAIRLYESIGFVEINEYMQETNGGMYPFITMQFGN